MSAVRATCPQCGHVMTIDLNSLRARGQLGNRTVNALLRGGYTTLEQVEAATDWELLACEFIGEGQLDRIRSYQHLPATATSPPPPTPTPPPRPAKKQTWTTGDLPVIFNHLFSWQKLYRWHAQGLWQSELPAMGGSGNHMEITVGDIEGIYVLARIYEERTKNLPAWGHIRTACQQGGIWIAALDGTFTRWTPQQPLRAGLLVDIDHLTADAHLRLKEWTERRGIRFAEAVAS